jgi:hypothetical protein
MILKRINFNGRRLIQRRLPAARSSRLSARSLARMQVMSLALATTSESRPGPEDEALNLLRRQLGTLVPGRGFSAAMGTAGLAAPRDLEAEIIGDGPTEDEFSKQVGKKPGEDQSASPSRDRPHQAKDLVDRRLELQDPVAPPRHVSLRISGAVIRRPGRRGAGRRSGTRARKPRARPRFLFSGRPGPRSGIPRSRQG